MNYLQSHFQAHKKESVAYLKLSYFILAFYHALAGINGLNQTVFYTFNMLLSFYPWCAQLTWKATSITQESSRAISPAAEPP